MKDGKLLSILGGFLFSGTIVVINAVLLMAALTICAHYLWLRVLPDQNPVTAWLFAAAIDSTVLISAANQRKLGNLSWFNVAFAISSGIAILLYLDLSAGSWLQIGTKAFLGCLGGFANYTYAELMVRRWQAYQEQQQAATELQTLRASHQQLQAGYKQTVAENEQLQADKQDAARWRDACTCPHCDYKADNPFAMRSHLGKCPSRPF